MKFLCDQCKAKYSIADERVRRKILKIRCKNCSHLITIRDPDLSNAGPAPASSQSAAASSPARKQANALEGAFSGLAGRGGPAEPAPAADEEWYVYIGTEQRGPVPLLELRRLIERGDAKAESFVWRDGFEDWMRADAVPELRPFLRRSNPPATTAGRPLATARPLTTGKVQTVPPKSALDERRGHLAAAAGGKREDLEMPDLSDALEDDSDAGLGALAARAHAHGGGASLGRAASASVQDEPLDFAISEPSRIVKLDNLAAFASNRSAASAGTGSVIRVPDVDIEKLPETAARASTSGFSVEPYAPAQSSPTHAKDHHLYKILAITGGVVCLMLVIVIISMLSRPSTEGTQKVVITKDKSPEELGSEIAEQLAREATANKFEQVVATPHAAQDVIAPARPVSRAGRSTAPLPPHKVMDTTRTSSKDDDRLSQLYAGGSKDVNIRGQQRTNEDALGQFKRGAKICYERALKKNPALMHVKIDIRIAVQADGGVSSVNIPSPYGSEYIGMCLSALIRKMPWPQKGEAYFLDAPLVLSGS